VSVPGGGVGYIPVWTPSTSAATSETTTSTGGDDDDDETNTETAEDQYWNWRKTQDELEIRQAQDSLISSISGIFSEYGLASLYDKIAGYVRQGYNGDAIAVLLRQTPEYKERFPAMEALSKKGRAITEAQYIAFERNASQLERAYGLPTGMLGKDAVTGLLTNEVSGQELEDRVTMAAAGAFQTAQEVRTLLPSITGFLAAVLPHIFLILSGRCLCWRSSMWLLRLVLRRLCRMCRLLLTRLSGFTSWVLTVRRPVKGLVRWPGWVV
jgi:hypothetical protein